MVLGLLALVLAIVMDRMPWVHMDIFIAMLTLTITIVAMAIVKILVIIMGTTIPTVMTMSMLTVGIVATDITMTMRNPSGCHC
mmetsp:Transcript_63982/g.101479  ORF Transcript_63982/g.101479 Transcript_63982/m.101479 type:complete len:83 (+) Transcript_63982:369-617(+)